jgi:hypothetical protein
VRTYGLLIFDGADELDFIGPWEVSTTSRVLRDNADTAVLIAEGARGSPARPRSRAPGPPVHPVRAGPAVPGPRADQRRGKASQRRVMGCGPPRNLGTAGIVLAGLAFLSLSVR